MKYSLAAVILSALLLIQGCSTSKKTVSHEWNTSPDPLEGLNRSIYAFNNKADKYILRPVANGYHSVMPDPAEKSVYTFFSNLGEPLSIVNNLLQGKLDGALNSTYRFTVNSTVGLFGLFDVAKHLGVDRKREDFGQTLAIWGVKPGPYLMLPLVGPTNLRDGISNAISTTAYYPIDEITSSDSGSIGLTALNVINARADLLQFDKTIDGQLDPYLFIKSTFENSRTDSINDGLDNELDLDF